MNKNTIVIDGFEFPQKYNDVPDVENLNYYLESRFHDFNIIDFLSRRHLDIFPDHIGLQSDDKFNLHIMRWRRSTVDDWGEYAPGWYAHYDEDPAKYKADILEFYQANDPTFYNFIKDRIYLP